MTDTHLDPRLAEALSQLDERAIEGISDLAENDPELLQELLADAGYDLAPENEVSSGHSIDFRVDGAEQTGRLVEVTRPLPPSERAAGSAVAAIKETVSTKTGGQLATHGGGVTLFVDCSSFDDGEWSRLADTKPDIGHRPAVVFRVRPGDATEAYTLGSVPVDLPSYVAVV